MIVRNVNHCNPINGRSCGSIGVTGNIVSHTYDIIAKSNSSFPTMPGVIIAFMSLATQFQSFVITVALVSLGTMSPCNHFDGRSHGSISYESLIY